MIGADLCCTATQVVSGYSVPCCAVVMMQAVTHRCMPACAALHCIRPASPVQTNPTWLMYIPDASDTACRGCQPGEQYDNNVCRECQEQTYSFHPGDDGGQCQTCPDVAHCPGGPIFVPDDFYWHSRYDSDTPQRCPNTFACRCVACLSV